MRLMYLYADTQQEWNCSRWRCHMLSNAINAAHEKNPKAFPHTAAMYQMATAIDFHNPVVQNKIGQSEIILFQRNVIDKSVYDAMDYWRALGKIVLVDLDDHYPNIPPSNPAFPFWAENSLGLEPGPVERLKEGLRHADALISPSKVILKDWAEVVPGYHWPNYPALEDYTGLEQKPIGAPDIIYDYDLTENPPRLRMGTRTGSPGQVTIGWGGSISHVDSFYYSRVLDGLAQLMDERPNVVLKFCGSENRLEWLIERLPEKRVIRHGGVAPDHWPKVVATFDIGIAPLDMRPVSPNTGAPDEGYAYDERRSWLKLAEYICAGVPFVATKSATYEDLGRYGKLVENTSGAWYEALKTRVDSLAFFKRDAWDLRRWGLKHLTIDGNVERLVKFYEKIALEAQTRQKDARLPDVLYA